MEGDLLPVDAVRGLVFFNVASAGDFGHTIAGTILCLSGERFHHSHCAALLLSELSLHQKQPAGRCIRIGEDKQRDRTLERCYSKPRGAFASDSLRL